MPPALFLIEWCNVNISHCQSHDFYAGNCSVNTKTVDPCFHWIPNIRLGRERGEDGRAYEGNQLHQHCSRWHPGCSYRVFHIPKVNLASELQTIRTNANS